MNFAGTAEIIEVEASHTTGVYRKRQVAIVRGQGAHVWDAEGHEYIDCVAGQGSANLGHCHPAVVAAINEQAGRLITCPETFHNDVRAALLHQLAQFAPLGWAERFCAIRGPRQLRRRSNSSELQRVGPGSWPRTEGFTAERWARCRPHGKRTIDGPSRRSYPVSATSRSTIRPPWRKQ